MNILITGAGSVLGQSVYRALVRYSCNEPLRIHFGNSDELGAGRYFSADRAPVVAAPILPLARDAGYLEFLEAYCAANDIAIVFPGTQHEIAKIADYRDQSGKAATFSGALTRLALNKLRLSATLRERGIRVPRDQPLREFLDVPKVAGPVIVKPIQSSSSRSIFHIDSCDNRSALANLLVQIGEERIDDFLVQQFVGGDEFTCGCYVDRYTQDISVIIFRRTLTPDGASGFGEVVASDVIEQYVREIAAVLIGTGLDYGNFNVQLRLGDDGPRLFEVNGRLSSTEAPKAALGFNSCGAFLDNIVFQRQAKLGPVATGKRFLRYYEEVYF